MKQRIGAVQGLQLAVEKHRPRARSHLAKGCSVPSGLQILSRFAPLQPNREHIASHESPRVVANAGSRFVAYTRERQLTMVRASDMRLNFQTK